MSGLLDPSERLEKLDRLGRILPPLQFSLQNKGFVLRRHRRTRRQRQLALHAPCRLRSAAPVLPQPILHVGRHPNIMASSLIAQDVDKMHTGFNWCPRPDLNRNTPRHVGAARSFRETGETRSPWPDSSTSSVFAPKQGLRASTAPTHSPPAPTRPSCAVSFAFRRSGVASADSPRRTSSQYNGVQPHRAGCRQNACRVQLVPPPGIEPGSIV